MPWVRVAIVSVVAVIAAACAESSSTVTTGPSPAKCQVTLSGTSSVEAAGGAGFVTVTTQPECVWNVSTASAWITGLTPTSGQGSGRVDFRVTANPASTSREAELVVNDARLPVTQPGGTPPACTYALSPATQTIAAAGGAGRVTVTAGSGCAWSATSSAEWLTLSTPAGGTASGTVAFTVAANTGADRSAIITVAGQQATVRQASTQSSCLVEIAPAGQSFGAAGGTGGPITVTTTATCAWTARTTDTWITLSGNSGGTGNGSVSFAVAANSGAARTGTITIGGATFTVSQAATVPPSCSFTIAPTNLSISAAGGAGPPITVTAGTGCSWTAGSNVTWITITGGATGSGNGNVTFTVDPNTATVERSGALTIAGQTFTVTQAAASAPCTYTVSPQTIDAGSLLESFTVRVTTAAGCAWSATTASTALIEITAGANGSGTGDVSFNVLANPTLNARVGTVVIGFQTGRQTITINQVAATCSYTLNPASINLSSSGTPGQTFTVTPNIATCNWSATSTVPAPQWLTISGANSGQGNGTVTYIANTNTGAARTGTITVGNQAFTVNQAAAACTFMLNPASATPPATGATNQSIAVTANLPTCTWTATSNATTWLTVASTTSTQVTYNVAPNTGAARSGALTIGDQTFPVTQANGCTLGALVPTSVNVVRGGGTGSVAISASAANCAWTATSNNTPWLTITGAASGSGSGSITYSVNGNGPNPRTGTITVTLQSSTAPSRTFTVSQAGN